MITTHIYVREHHEFLFHDQVTAINEYRTLSSVVSSVVSLAWPDPSMQGIYIDWRCNCSGSGANPQSIRALQA